MEIINLLISTVLQLVLFSALPFVWWLVTKRKEVTFLTWVGLKKPLIKDLKKYVISCGLTLLLFISVSLIVPFFVNSSDMATSQFSGKGFGGLLPALIYAFFQTGLTEELLFRGFLTKRLIKVCGFIGGNIVQSLLFGLMHGIIFFGMIGLVKTLMIILITSVIGFLMGWINEKQSEGSIVSSWMLHGCANLLAALIALFNLL